LRHPNRLRIAAVRLVIAAGMIILIATTSLRKRADEADAEASDAGASD